jgi:hypothetical protein
MFGLEAAHNPNKLLKQNAENLRQQQANGNRSTLDKRYGKFSRHFFEKKISAKFSMSGLHDEDTDGVDHRNEALIGDNGR